MYIIGRHERCPHTNHTRVGSVADKTSLLKANSRRSNTHDGNDSNQYLASERHDFSASLCSPLSSLGNLMSNLILRSPLLAGDFDRGMPSPTSTLTYFGLIISGTSTLMDFPSSRVVHTFSFHARNPRSTLEGSTEVYTRGSYGDWFRRWRCEIDGEIRTNQGGDPTVESGDEDAGAEQRLVKIDGDCFDEIVAVALKLGMFLLIHDEDYIRRDRPGSLRCREITAPSLNSHERF